VGVGGEGGVYEGDWGVGVVWVVVICDVVGDDMYECFVVWCRE